MHPEVRMMYGLPKLMELVSKKSPDLTRRDRCAPSGLIRLLVRVMYFEKPKTEAPIPVSLPSALLLLGLMAGILLIGVWQAPFFRAASQASTSLF